MKIVLFGQKWLAAEVLKAITALPGVDVVTVCPDTETPDVLRRAAFEWMRSPGATWRLRHIASGISPPPFVAGAGLAF